MVEQKCVVLASQCFCREPRSLDFPDCWLVERQKGRYRPGLFRMHGTWQECQGRVVHLLAK